MIRASVRSDCGQIEREFDASVWAEQASHQAIVNLIKGGFENDYAADDVALYMVGRDSGVEEVFKFLDLTRRQPGSYEANGFECRVNGSDFLDWLIKNRSNALNVLLKKAFEVPEDDLTPCDKTEETCSTRQEPCDVTETPVDKMASFSWHELNAALKKIFGVSEDDPAIHSKQLETNPQWQNLLGVAMTVAWKVNQHRNIGEVTGVNQCHIDFLQAMIRFKECTQDRTMSLIDMYSLLRLFEDKLATQQKKLVKSDAVKDRCSNYYSCSGCDKVWISYGDWDSTCEDKCPKCNKATKPYKSESIV